MCVDLVEFTDEEGYGKYLDMHPLHDKYLNLKHLEVNYTARIMLCYCDCSSYLASFEIGH